MTHRSEVRLPTFNLLMESDEIYLYFSYLTSVHWVQKKFWIDKMYINAFQLNFNNLSISDKSCPIFKSLVQTTYSPIQYFAMYFMVGLKSCYYLLKLLRYCIFLGIDIVATTVLSTNPDLRAKIPQKLLKRCAPQKSLNLDKNVFFRSYKKEKKRNYLGTFWKVGWADYLVK